MAATCSDSTPDLAGSSTLGADLDGLVPQAIDLVGIWLKQARSTETKQDYRTAERLHGVVADPDGVRFAMRFVDRVIRPEDNRVAGHQLRELTDTGSDESLPGFLSRIDKTLLRIGGRLAPILPGVVIPLATRRMRQLVGHLVADAEPDKLAAHLAHRRAEGYRLNVNLLGEAVLGPTEADRRFEQALALLDQPDVTYVSVKLSGIVADLNYWDYDASIERVVERMRPLFAKALATDTFVNLDMEEYHDLELTSRVFTTLLDEPEFHRLPAGIVLQAYLPDSFAVLQQLTDWAAQRQARVVDGQPGADIKIRLVKGANLAMERVEAAMNDWEVAPYTTKADTDANYKRCLDWVMHPERTSAVRIGVASHNLFDIAFAHLAAERRDVAERVEFEMLEGMASAEARVLLADYGEVLLYTPAVAAAEFDVAISYLFRRLEENAADENFVRHLFGLTPGSAAFDREAAKFTDAVQSRWHVAATPSRQQNRLTPEPSPVDDTPFVNDAPTDPSLPGNRDWAEQVVAAPPGEPNTPITTNADSIDAIVTAAVSAQRAWAAVDPAERRAVLHSIADEFDRRRGDLMAAMIYEGRKTFHQADIEVCEAIDFARYYGDRAVELTSEAAVFEPLGVIGVIPPWNFPVAIPAGGVLASLAAGNAVVLKPAPEVPRCAEIVAECAHAVLFERGHPVEVVTYVRTHDDEVGQHLITHDDVAAIILTGAYETADLFRSWKPDLAIFAETSGKNALVITPNADLDLAVADLSASAFGHSGQKCSAASLAICVGDVYDSARFRRQLVDAVEALTIGASTDLASTFGPTITEPTGKLLRALTELETGEEWLIRPERRTVTGRDANGAEVEQVVWTPGVRLGVRPGSWFHVTECFGPVLGIMHADTLEEAIEMQNATSFGLTGGIHTLDPDEADTWTESVQVGNAYINRQITGAIVQRQPFGGWKRSTIGPGAKAGGPHYVAQLGTWKPTTEPDSATVEADRAVWNEIFAVRHDPTALFCEANELRYVPLPTVIVHAQPGADEASVSRAVQAATVAVGDARVITIGADQDPIKLALGHGVERVRVIGTVSNDLRAAANEAGIYLNDRPVTADPHLELHHYVREQSISRTLHRYGNVIGA